MTEQTLNEESLKAFFDGLSDDQKNYTVKTVLGDLRKIRSFKSSLQHISDLQSIQTKINTVVGEWEKDIEQENKKKEQESVAQNAAAKAYVEAMAEAGVEVSLDEALAKFQGNAVESTSDKETKAKTKKAANPSVKVTLRIENKEFDNISLGARGQKNQDVLKALEAIGVDYTDRYKYVVLLDRQTVLDAVKANKIMGFPISYTELQAFYAQDDSSDTSDKPIISLMLDIGTAKEKFNVEIAEDFVFEGTEDELFEQHEKLLIAVSDDDTVEGGVAALEAL
ncbi:hypothetical protein MW344_004780 [Vibrio parahaemolyticus]|nr:hypothetical protein [Vibrio parahaemolyticus]